MKTIVTLTGKNDVKLKAIERSDLEDMAVLANDPAVAANLRDTFPSPYSLKDAEEFLSLIEQGKLNHVWGIYAKDKIAGAITLTPQTDIYRHSAEIGYWLGAPFHGKGIMTEAVSLLTEYAFREMNILRIYAGVFAYNEASKKVLMKSGYHLEAVKVKAVIKNDVLHDEHLMVKMNI
ncbi:GNAT family N-acetyltransferase [Chitinophaga polysaccharea]|uniref:GNAT family N-acetyltransferase n=1 Tax=Chitinophaga TaxID=79328 RepID=UPI0014556C8C|nr:MULTISPECIES: GNAT family N-acetyltransferase [Chitinophaga]NLR61795.1 GNAT family N-acetyltransferase [Chitinophaga polysaccharea]NLU92663.1 GNAT family N-acetyltransferase [Chitinophaga sp. Ak27]